MTSGDSNQSQDGAGADAAADGHDEMQATMREFAESATAMAAASIRMQMMMLEQTRAMLDDFTGMMAEAGNATERAAGSDDKDG